MAPLNMDTPFSADIQDPAPETFEGLLIRGSQLTEQEFYDRIMDEHDRRAAQSAREEASLVTIRENHRRRKIAHQLSADRETLEMIMLLESYIQQDKSDSVIYDASEDPTKDMHYQEQSSSDWKAYEPDYTQDAKDILKCTPAQRYMIQYIHAFFLKIETAVNDSMPRFIEEASNQVARTVLQLQVYQETVHTKSYSMGGEVVFPGHNGKTRLRHMADNSPAVTRQVEYFHRCNVSNEPRFIRVLRVACGEGVGFMTKFAGIFYFRARGMFPGIVHANEMISRDESNHRDMGVAQYLESLEALAAMCDKYLSPEWKERIFEYIARKSELIIQEQCELEIHGIPEMIPQPLGDLNMANLTGYVHKIANNLRDRLGLPLDLSHPAIDALPWMDGINQDQRTNPHELNTGSYQNNGTAEEQAENALANMKGYEDGYEF